MIVGLGACDDRRNYDYVPVLIAPFRALIGFRSDHIVPRLAGSAFHLFGLVRFGRWVDLPSCHLPCSFIG